MAEYYIRENDVQWSSCKKFAEKLFPKVKIQIKRAHEVCIEKRFLSLWMKTLNFEKDPWNFLNQLFVGSFVGVPQGKQNLHW